MRARRFTAIWCSEIRDAKRLEDKHRRKHPMVYGWLCKRWYGPGGVYRPMLTYEWQAFHNTEGAT